MPFSLGRFAQTAAGRLTVRSALNPLLWLCGIVAVPCLTLAALFRDDRVLMSFLIAAALLTLIVTNFIAVRFAIVSPEKLQSEDYQLRHQSLQILQGATGPQVFDSNAIIAIANPALPALTEAAGAEHAEQQAQEGNR